MPTAKPKKMTKRFSKTDAPLRRMIRRLEIQNTILYGKDVFHFCATAGPTYAWSTGNEISFNVAQLPSPEAARDIMFITGVNNHELAHVMFTPTLSQIQTFFDNRLDTRIQAMIVSLLKNNAYQHYFNVLEDQRIEMLKVKRHANQVPYFKVVFTRLMRENLSHNDTMYLLARGRKYLPLKIRRRLMKRFKYPHLIPAIRRIIDEYITLNLFRYDDLLRAHRLITQLVDLMDTVNNLSKDLCHAHKAMLRPELSTVDAGRTRDQRAVPDSDALEAIDAALSAIKQDVAADDGEGQPGSGGTGASEDASKSDQDLIEEVEQEVEEDFAVADEVSKVRQYISQPSADYRRLRRTEPVDMQLPMLARKISAELRRKEEEAEPYWEVQTNSGKLDPLYAMRHTDDLEHSFRRWEDAGTTGVDQEWVVLLDCSDSMRTHLAKLSKVGWVLKRAADLTGVQMTIIAYGSKDPLLTYGVTDRADMDAVRQMENLGGTKPASVLATAHHLLATSKRSQRVMFVMTDGSWTLYDRFNDEQVNADELIASMNGHGITTHLCFLGGRGSETHNCASYSTIDQLDTLPEVFRDLMKTMVGRKR